MVINKMSMPIINKVMPRLIAQDIIGVQPMSVGVKEVKDTRVFSKKKYNFSRVKWYTVNIGSNWFLSKEYKKRVEWCIDNFGPKVNNPDAWSRWYTDFNVIKFRDEDDAVLFKLKWSNV